MQLSRGIGCALVGSHHPRTHVVRSAPHHRSPCLRPSQHHNRITPANALGFDFGEPPEPERRNRKRFSTLGTVAASLLVVGSLRTGSVAEAFLACLAATQKMQASNKDILAAYSRFYGLLLAAGYDSWQDYLIDQLLLGRDNPVARAAAQGTLDEGSPVLKALAHDLDLLQILAVSLHDLAEYIGEMAPFAGPEWVTAGSQASFQRPAQRLGTGRAPRVSAIDLDTKSKFITRPPTQEELTQWKDLITSKEYWSQAVPVVQQFWHLHGFGITSRNTTLRWVKGALDEAPDAQPPTPNTAAAPTAASLNPAAPLSCLEQHRHALAVNTQRHCEGLSASHVLVAGPSGTGKSWLLWDSTLAAGRDRGVRIVDLNGADGTTILEAARGCGRYPRLRFILVADHVDLPLRGPGANDLMAGLSNVGPGGWPSNTLLYLGATATSTVTRDPLVSRFPATIFTTALSESEFAATVQELVRHRSGKEAPEQLVQAAQQWASKTAGSLTVRSASQYLDLESIV